MSSTCPCVAAAPSNSALTVAASTPEAASVTVYSIALKSSESNVTPSGAGLVIVICGGVVSSTTVRVTGAPASSSSAGSNVWHGSAVRSCTVVGAVTGVRRDRERPVRARRPSRRPGCCPPWCSGTARRPRLSANTASTALAVNWWLPPT